MTQRTGLATKGIRATAKAPPKKDPLTDHWTPGCRSALRSAVSNGQWPQVRLKRAGLADTDVCQLCHSAPGTLLHRRHCQVSKAARGDSRVPKHLEATYEELTADQKRILQTRGFVELPDISQHPRSTHDTMQWTVYPEDGVLQTGWKVYLDGSLRDEPNEHLTRAGFGFIAYDQEGKVKAAACGVPPPWINSIHGAELWALFAALRIAMPGVAYRSDRKAVVDTFKAGEKTATAATVEMARLWKLVFAACDDTPSPHLDVDLEWMPAHTKPGDVDVIHLSDGSLLTKRDRQANDAADFLAKRGAQTHRVPRKVWLAFKEREQLAEWAARTLGLATFAVNNHKDDGEKGTRRDSTGLPKAKRPKKTTAAASKDLASHGGPSKEPNCTTETASSENKHSAAVKRSSTQDSSSSCDSSEVDLDPQGASSSARACRARQTRLAEEKTLDIAKTVARRSLPDENGATAPHRLRNVRKRIQWRESLAAHPASYNSPRPPARQPANSEATEAASPVGEASMTPLSAVDGHEATNHPLSGEPPGERPCRRLSSSRATPSESSAGGITRPTRAPRTSLAAERRATAAAVSSLLS